MPSVDREESRDRDAVIRHQHSFSESGRASIPMWDSSDPDRAPPPLPLNPSTSSPATRPNTSAAVAARAAELTERVRENAAGAYTTNTSPTKSTERSLIKGAHHKRMQSVQSTNVRDLSSYLENRSPERSPERTPRTPTISDPEKTRDLSPIRSGTPTPTGRDSGRETPTLRPSSRYLSKPILGENTPPSATMLALQNMQLPASVEAPLSNITNSSSALVRTPQSFDAISSQILSLTSIATNLQREMAQLSRRSKDNATDLVSLKEATNSRDEDIRKSLRELVTNISTKFLDHPSEGSKNGNHLNAGSFMLDSKAFGSPPGRGKNFSLPRIPSPNSFAAAIERDMTASPSTISSDGSASIALLEKILREMSTKDGQDKVLKILGELRSKPTESKTDPFVLKKLEEIAQLVKENAENRALVRANKNGGVGNKPPQLELDFDHPRSGPLTRSAQDVTPPHTRDSPQNSDPRKGNGNAQPSDVVNEEVMKILKKVKNSVAEGGGLTNEVKGLVRDLRGEVLGMGREIARKLEQAESTHGSSRNDAHGPGREEIAHIVETGLVELKDHMDHLIREKRRQSSSSNISRSTVDSQEVYVAVKNALAQYPLLVQRDNGPGLEKEEILEAVREAWETYKPEIELQNFGLERDEILDCLKEGLKAYQPQQQSREVGITSEEVLEAVNKGMQTFIPPPVESEASITREEIIMSVRECLESFEFPTMAPAVSREPDLTRDDVIDAVKEGLLNQGPITNKEIEFNREDLFDAVKAGLEGTPTAMDGVGEQVLEKMHELIEGMRGEFKQYSAANGRDTEQVLDAMKDGLETLRGDIESYVDRAADVTGKDEIIDVVKDGLRQVQTDLESSIANAPRPRSSDTTELLDAMEKEFEHLRQTISNMLTRQSVSSDKDEILDAIRDISDRDRDDGSSISSDRSNHIVRTMKEEFEHLRETLATTMMRAGSSSDKEEILDAIREAGMDAPKRGVGNESILSNTSELLDAFNDGLEGLKSDMEKIMNKPVDMSTSYEILDTLKDGLAGVRADIDLLHVSNKEYEDASTTRGREVMVADENQLRTDIEGLKVMITQLRIKVESLDSMPAPPAPEPDIDRLSRDDLDGIHATLKEVRESVHGFGDRGSSVNENAATKDDTDALETLLRNTKAQLDEMASRGADGEGTARSEHLETVESAVKDTKEAIDDLAANLEANGASKEDFSVLEVLLKEVSAGVEEMQSKIKRSDEEMVTKTDIQAVETLCLDTKTQMEELILPDVETLPTKTDIAALEEKIVGFKEQVEAESELTAQAFEARKIEHGGIANKIEDVRALLGDVRDELKSKLEDGQNGLVEMSKVLDTWNEESFGTFATAKSVQELAELVNREFERTHDNHSSTKLENEDRDAILLVRHDESRATVIAELSSKIDDRFNEIMIKYDDAQLAADAKLQAFDTRDSQNLEALTSTKAVMDDVKLLIDTLGTTVSETCDRLNDDSKTVYAKVEESVTRLDELQSDSKFEHGLTRDEVAKTLITTSRVEAQITDWHPQILNSVKDLLLMVGQHYEHSQKSSDDIKASVSASISAIPIPAITAPPSPPLPREIPVTEKYDDSQVHDKLNVLLNHATAAGKSFAQIDRLDQIHEQVRSTAAEVSELVATQSRLMAEDHGNKQQEAQQAAIALEKRLAQKERVEAEVVSLNEEKDALLNAVQAMKQEKEELARQTTKLSKEVSSLETALQIRREEMRIMEDRAEGLERRILEGVLDHARSVLISKPSSTRDMNLKRVPSSASTVTRASTVGTARDSSVLSTSVGMALKRRTPMSSSANSVASSGKGRRIMSLSQVTGNKPTPDRQLMLAPTRGEGGLTSLKRSHSVKSNFPARKSSWAGRSSVVDQENVFHEEDEGAGSGDDASEAGTERRTSYTGTCTERRTSYTGTCTDSLTYGTGSTVSATDTEGRHSSFGTSTGALVGGRESEVSVEDEHDHEVDEGSVRGLHDGEEEGSQLEPHDRQLVLKSPTVEEEDPGVTLTLKDVPEYAESEDHDDDQQHQREFDHLASNGGEMTRPSPDLLDDFLQELETPKPTFGEVVMYGQHSDSGLGTDIPTAAMTGGTEQDYFEKK